MKKAIVIPVLAVLLFALFAVVYAANVSDTPEDHTVYPKESETGDAHTDEADHDDTTDHDAENMVVMTSADDHGSTDHAETGAHDTDDGHAEESEAGAAHTDEMDHDTDDDHAADSEAEAAHTDEIDHDTDDDHVAVASADVPNSTDHADTAGHDADGGHTSDTADEVGSGHGHGEPQIGYIGLAEKTEIDADELARFVERVEEEAYKKGELDQIRFALFGLFFLITYLAFAKIKRWNLSYRLKNAIDWHTLGTVTGIILIFLVIPTGIIITFFFMPTSTGAYGSVENMTNQPALAFFRNLHNWSSEVFIFLSLLHAARTVSTKTFLGNRKFIWLLGAIALVVGWIAFLSGTFMRGDQEALEGFEHMMYSFSLVPLGQAIADFFSGEYTMMKLTTLHIGATIFIMAVTLVLHVLMRKVHVLVTTRWKKAVAYSLAFTLFLVVQSVLMEAPFIVGPESGPTVSGIEATKPPWPIYFLIQGENWLGADAMVLILTVAFVPLIVFPYAVEFLPLTTAKKSRVGEALFYVGIFLMIAISYIAAAGEIKAHIF